MVTSKIKSKAKTPKIKYHKYTKKELKKFEFNNSEFEETKALLKVNLSTLTQNVEVWKRNGKKRKVLVARGKHGILGRKVLTKTDHEGKLKKQFARTGSFNKDISARITFSTGTIRTSSKTRTRPKSATQVVAVISVRKVTKNGVPIGVIKAFVGYSNKGVSTRVGEVKAKNRAILGVVSSGFAKYDSFIIIDEKYSYIAYENSSSEKLKIAKSNSATA